MKKETQANVYFYRSISHRREQVFSSLILLLNKKKKKKLQVGIKVTPWFSSYQTVGVDLLGLNFLVCCDLLDILLRFL